MLNKCAHFTIFLLCLHLTWAYSPTRDARIIAEFKKQQSRQQLQDSQSAELNHIQIARTLVAQTDWASVGTISIDPAVTGYPMVNIISINDHNRNGTATGRIRFLLTDLDFTGQDWQQMNKATFMFTNEQKLYCSHHSPNTIDPMEPTCPRVIMSGQIKKMDMNSPQCKEAIEAFVQRHPAARNWLKAHAFYMCELDIKNIYVLDFYGGPHNVKVADYYSYKV